MLNAVTKFEPHRFTGAIASLSNEALSELVSQDAAVAPVTHYARKVSLETLRRHERLGLTYTHNHLARGNFAREVDWAEAVIAAIPPVPDLAAQYRFAVAAAMVPARREAISSVIEFLVKALATSGGSAAPERMLAIVATVADHEDDATIYGRVLTGFSVPVVQIAARNVLECSKFCPAPVEVLAECRKAREFFRLVTHATRTQAALLKDATALINAGPAPQQEINAPEIEF